MKLPCLSTGCEEKFTNSQSRRRHQKNCPKFNVETLENVKTSDQNDYHSDGNLVNHSVRTSEAGINVEILHEEAVSGDTESNNIGQNKNQNPMNSGNEISKEISFENLIFTELGRLADRVAFLETENHQLKLRLSVLEADKL